MENLEAPLIHHAIMDAESAAFSAERAAGSAKRAAEQVRSLALRIFALQDAVTALTKERDDLRERLAALRNAWDFIQVGDLSDKWDETVTRALDPSRPFKEGV